MNKKNYMPIKNKTLHKGIGGDARGIEMESRERIEIKRKRQKIVEMTL